MADLFETRRSAVSIDQFDPSETTERIADPVARLKTDISSFEAMSCGKLGIYAKHSASDFAFGYRSEEAFPMASVFKLALALTLLRDIDRGDLTLDEMLEVSSDLKVPPPLIEHYFPYHGLVVSVANLFDVMMVTSDNAATDTLLRSVGGPARVQAELSALGIDEIRVDRSTSQFLADFLSVPIESGSSFAEEFASMNPQEQAELYRRTNLTNAEYEQDARDTSSPRAIIKLLNALRSDNYLSAENRARLEDVMLRCENNERLRGMLPPQVNVAHKTGTLGGTTNDVGWIELPYGLGTLDIAIFVSESTAETRYREVAIAHCARAIFDFLVYSASSKPEEEK